MPSARSFIDRVNSGDTLTQEQLFPLFSQCSCLVKDCVRILILENSFVQLRILDLGAEVASNLDRNKAIYRRSVAYSDDILKDVPSDNSARESNFLSCCMDLQQALLSGDKEKQLDIVLSLPLTRMVFEQIITEWYALTTGYKEASLASLETYLSGGLSSLSESDLTCHSIEQNAGLEPRTAYGVVSYVGLRLLSMRKIYDRIFEAYARVILKLAKTQAISEDHSLDCLSGDSIVWTDRGLTRIDGFVPSSVDTTSGVKEAYPHFIDNKILPTIKTKSRLGLEIIATPDHQVKVLNETTQKLEWSSLSDSLGRYVLVATGSDLVWPSDPVINWEAPVDGLKRNGHIPSSLTPSLASLMGYLISEGTVFGPDSSNKGSIGFSNSNPEILSSYLEDLKSAFGVSPQLRDSGVTELVFVDHNVNDILRHLGCDYVYSGDKVVPWSIMQGSKESIVSFIRSYWEGDGSLVDRPYCGSKSERLITELQQLLLRLGISSKKTLVLKSTDFYGNPTNKELRMHHLTVTSNQDARKFIDVIGYTTTTSAVEVEAGGKRPTTGYSMSRCSRNIVPGASAHITPSKTNHHTYFCDLPVDDPLRGLEGRFIFDKIVSIEDAGIRPVYDISVSDVHEFIANGQIVSNCYQNGSFGLIRAVSSYDHISNARFVGHARWWIRQRMLLHLKEDSNIIKVSSNTWQHYAKLEEFKRKHESKKGPLDNKSLSTLSGYSESHIGSIYGMVRASQVRSLDYPLKTTTLSSFIEAAPDTSPVNEMASDSVRTLLKHLPRDLRNTVCLSFGLTEYVDQNLEPSDVEKERQNQTT